MSAATLMVILALPLARPVTVTWFPLTLALAIVGALLCALMAPVPERVTVMTLLVALVSRVMLVGEMVRLPAAFWMLQAAVLADVVPSIHW